MRSTDIACHRLPLAVLMPRRFSSSAAACVDRCMVSVMTGRTASAPLLGLGNASIVAELLAVGLGGRERSTLVLGHGSEDVDRKLGGCWVVASDCGL
jgi:hypothetical protein